MSQRMRTAKALAERHPAGRFPCPSCGNVVGAGRLGSHLHDCNPGGAGGQTVEETGGGLILRGKDWRIIGPMFVLLGLVTLVPFTVLLLLVMFVPDFDFDPQGSILWLAWCLLLFGALGGVALAYYEKLPATLRVDGDRLRLEWGLGRLSHEVALPAKLETGILYKQTPSGGHAASQHGWSRGTFDDPIGHFLRLETGSGVLVVGFTSGGPLEGRWGPEGWTRPEGRTRRCDIVLDGAARAALELHLAERGLLVPLADGRRDPSPIASG